MKLLISITELNTNTPYYIESGLGGRFKLRFQSFDQSLKKYCFKNVSPGWERFNYQLKEIEVLERVWKI